ncbi:hypothetical protein WJX72_002631 [[Myrmecia] bisecta]|uniref:S-acyltransferase n=1 Tax=[Myrmecia] bisecta TaxID=41462 RepID=A0AAW1Q6R6_9CHLO
MARLRPCSSVVASRPARAAAWLSQKLIVALVSGAITSIAAVGFFYLLPSLFHGWVYFVHIGVATVVAFNLFWNFLACLCQAPGSPADSIVAHAHGQVPQGAYDNYSYCRRCRFVKPPQAHHCKVCGLCVMEMDHHCPFINNCVGARNARHFLLFLFWLLLGCIYITVLSIVLMRYRWFDCIEAASDAWLSTPAESVGQVLSFSMRAMYGTPLWLSMTFYALCMSGGALVGVGVLLVAQLRLAIRGQTYIDQLRHGGSGAHSASAMANLRLVFGQGHPLLWLRPMWGRPVGVSPSDIESKRR